MPPSFQIPMLNKIKIKSKTTGKNVLVDAVGQYLYYDPFFGHIYLQSSRDLLIRATFEVEFGAMLARSIHNRYGERLGWLGWEPWLSSLTQIHHGEPDNFIFGDFIRELEQFDGVITEEIAQEVMKCIRDQAQ